MPHIRVYADGAQAILGKAGRIWVMALYSDPPWKGVTPHSPARWDVQVSASRAIFEENLSFCNYRNQLIFHKYIYICFRYFLKRMKLISYSYCILISNINLANEYTSYPVALFVSSLFLRRPRKDIYQDGSVIGRHFLNRGVCLTVQSIIHPLLVCKIKNKNSSMAT